MTIAEVEQATYQVRIESDSGTIFRPESSSKVLTAKLYRGNVEVVGTSSDFSYQWYLDNAAISGATAS